MVIGDRLSIYLQNDSQMYIYGGKDQAVASSVPKNAVASNEFCGVIKLANGKIEFL